MIRSWGRPFRPVVVLLTGCVFLSAVGCAGPGAVMHRHPAGSADAVFDAAVTLLRDEGFPVDRQDRRFGVVTSEPALSPTALEPWAGDNHTADLAWASTAGMLRRVATIRFNPEGESADDTSGFHVEIEVQLERFQAPTRRVLNGARGRVFTALSATPSPWADRGIPSRYWEPIGRDAELEARLHDALLDRLSGGP